MSDFKNSKFRNLEIVTNIDIDYNFEKMVEYCNEFGYEYASIVHLESRGENNDHLHFGIFFPNPRSLNNVSKDLDIGINFIEKIKNKTRYIQYLTHCNDDEKPQYSISEIESNLQDIQSFFVEQKKSEAETKELEQVNQIYDLVSEVNVCYDRTKRREVFRKVLDRGLYSAYRRGYSIFKDLMKDD